MTPEEERERRRVSDHRYNTSPKGRERAHRYNAAHREERSDYDAHYRATTAGILAAERAYQRRFRGDA